QVGMRGGHARLGHRHHPTVDLNPVPVRVEEIEGVAPATADESLLASLGGVHVGTADDIHAARAHMIEGQEPSLARVDLERDVIEAWGSADAGVGRCDACLPHVLRKLEQHHIVVLVVDAHEANGPPEVGRTPTPRYLETQHLAIEVDRAIDIVTGCQCAQPGLGEYPCYPPCWGRSKYNRVSSMPSHGRDQGRNLVVVGSPLADHRGQIMKRLTSAELFAPPNMARKTKARLERAKLVVVAARERAAGTAQQRAAPPSTMRPPTVWQRRRLAERLSAKS